MSVIFNKETNKFEYNYNHIEKYKKAHPQLLKSFNETQLDIILEAIILRLDEFLDTFAPYYGDVVYTLKLIRDYGTLTKYGEEIINKEKQKEFWDYDDNLYKVNKSTGAPLNRLTKLLVHYLGDDLEFGGLQLNKLQKSRLLSSKQLRLIHLIIKVHLQHTIRIIENSEYYKNLEHRYIAPELIPEQERNAVILNKKEKSEVMTETDDNKEADKPQNKRPSANQGSKHHKKKIPKLSETVR